MHQIPAIRFPKNIQDTHDCLVIVEQYTRELRRHLLACASCRDALIKNGMTIRAQECILTFMELLLNVEKDIHRKDTFWLEVDEKATRFRTYGKMILESATSAIREAAVGIAAYTIALYYVLSGIFSPK